MSMHPLLRHSLLGFASAGVLAGTLAAAPVVTSSKATPHPPLSVLRCNAPRWLAPVPTAPVLSTWTRWAWSFADIVGNAKQPGWSEATAPWLPANRAALIHYTLPLKKDLSVIWGGPTTLWRPALALTISTPNAAIAFPGLTTPHTTITTMIWGILRNANGALVNTLPAYIPAKDRNAYTSGEPFRAAFAITLTAALSSVPGPTEGRVITYHVTPEVLPVSGPVLTTVETAKRAIAQTVLQLEHDLPRSVNPHLMVSGLCHNLPDQSSSAHTKTRTP